MRLREGVTKSGVKETHKQMSVEGDFKWRGNKYGEENEGGQVIETQEGITRR